MNNREMQRVLRKYRGVAQECRDAAEEFADIIENDLEGVPDRYAEYYRGKAMAYDEVQESLAEGRAKLREQE